MESGKNHARSRRNRWLIIGAIVGVIAVIVIGVATGVTVHNNKKKNNSNISDGSSGSSTSSGGSGSSGGSSGGGSSGGGSSSGGTGDSNFKKDPRLIRSFFGLAYQPEGSLLPNCSATQDAVTKDIQLMSQLTRRIRLYGADCNQSALVLEAIKRTKVDMEVYLGNYPNPDDNNEAYIRQRDVIKDAITTYGTDHIAGVTVGNEFMLNYVTEKGGIDPNSVAAGAGASILTAAIDDTRKMLAGMNLKKNIPVGNSDAGSYFNTQVLEKIDYGLSNVHPWFASVSIDQASAWTAEFFDQTNVQVAAKLPNKPTMYIAETGWPTKSSDAAHASDGASLASEANLQIFLDTFVCQANKNGTGYFFFEFFDEKWKDDLYGGVEGWWGLFTGNRTLKNIVIPNCPIN
jgi:exo-beta-1,3-glucanase (GH17 family)